MTGREKLQKALNHTEGPIPLDFGGTTVSGIHCSVLPQLREVYGLERRPVKIIEPFQMVGYIEDDLRDAMGIDLVGIIPYNTMFGFPLEGWKEWRTPWNQTVLVPQGFEVAKVNNRILIYPQSDRTVPPSGEMPEGSYYFDVIIRQPPIEEDMLDPNDNTEEFCLFNDADIQHLKASYETVRNLDKGVVANFGGSSFGDIAQIPGPSLKYPKGIRDVVEWYISTVSRQDHIHSIFERQSEIALKNLETAFSIVGNNIDVALICGTDFGTQVSQFCSVETFRSLYLPYYKKINDWIHSNTSWKTFKHSCGSIEPLIESFIDAGFDIINPVQITATGMDPKHLKEAFGDRIVYWGGGVDTQGTLPYGTPNEVRQEVKKHLDIFGREGGYVFNVIHNLQAGFPMKNFEVMMETFHEFNSKR